MDNDDARVGQILSRRAAILKAGSIGFGILGGSRLWAAGQGSVAAKPVNVYATPALTEGPFFVDEKLNRSDLIGDTKRTAVLAGLPLAIEVVVYQLTATGHVVLPGAQVDVWHCDTAGVYSDEPGGMNPEDTSGQHWLRGYQLTDTNGIAKFTTVYPGWYPGRATHIHFKVRVKGREFTSQWFFDETTNRAVYGAKPYSSNSTERMPNNGDGIYRERQSDGSAAGSHLLLTLADSTKATGKLGRYIIALDLG